MDKQEVFHAAFLSEIQKLGGFGDVMFTLGKALGKAKSVVAPALETAGRAYQGSAVGKYLAQSPRASKALGFAGNMVAGGAAFTLAQKALEPAKKEVHVLPQQAQQGVLSQFQLTPLQRYGV